MKNYFYKISCLSFIALAVVGCTNESSTVEENNSVVNVEQVQKDVNIWPVLEIDVKKNIKIEQKIGQLLSNMTLEQKVAQMIQPEIRDITIEDMRKYGFGSY